MTHITSLSMLFMVLLAPIFFQISNGSEPTCQNIGCQYVSEPKSFTDASEYCKNVYGTDLASFSSSDQEEAVSAMGDENEAWIGVYSAGTHGQWKYINGDDCRNVHTVYKCVDNWLYRLDRHTKFRPRCIGEDEGGYQCAHFKSNEVGIDNDLDCEEERTFFCERGNITNATAELIHYIANLPISGPPIPISDEDDDGDEEEDDEDSADVVAGAVMAFSKGVTKQHSDDAKNSILLAQLAANAAVTSRQIETIEWYDKFVEVLAVFGWGATSFQFTNYKAAGNNIQMDKVALDLIAALVSGDALVAITAALEALRNLDDGDKALTIWETNAAKGEFGNFQIGTVTEDSDGNVEFDVSVNTFRSAASQSRFLFFSWSTTDIELEVGSDRLVLSENIYEQVRAAVIEKLGTNAVDYLAKLNI